MSQPLQSGDDVRRNWLKINELDRKIEALTKTIAAMQFSLAEARRKPDQPPEMHPFKIYQIPSIFRAAGTATADDWRKFRVRGGRIVSTEADGPDIVGTDEADFPDGPLYPNRADVEITVTANVEQYWIWITVADDGLSGLIKHGADPTTNGWDAFPTIDANVPIGWVDTSTQLADKVALVRQLLRTDLVSGGGIEMELCTDTGLHTYRVQATLIS
jgi:hypothetical protein